MRRIARVKGMHCSVCETRVKKALSEAGYTVLKVSRDEEVVVFECGCEGTCSCPDPADVIEGVGYAVAGVGVVGR